MIERTLENFKKVGRSNLTAAKIRSRVTSLKESWTAFINGHAEFTKLISETQKRTTEYFKDNHFERTEDAYQTALDYMADCLEELKPPVNLNSSVTASPGSRAQREVSSFSLSHLPHINLPPFDGKSDEWELFRDRFTALIINNADLQSFAKMHFLVSSLKGAQLH